MRFSRFVSLVLCALFLLSLCACTQGGQTDDPALSNPSNLPSQSTPQTPVQNPSASGLPVDPDQEALDPSAAAPGALEMAPALTVQAENAQIDALSLVDGWSYSKNDDSVVICETYAPPTLEQPLEDLPRLYTRQEVLQLHFDDAPDSVSVRCWNEVGWGLSPEPAQEILCAGELLSIPTPVEQNRVFEITADWQRSTFSGTVRYLFRISPEVSLEISGGQPVDPEELELPFASNPQVYPLIVESGDAVRCCLTPGGGEDTVYVEMQQDDDIGMLRLSHFIINYVDYASALSAAGFFFDMPDSAYAITDLDAQDGFLEIALQEQGSSDDLRTTFFRYDGSQLLYIGRVEGLVFSPSLGWSDITFSGDGTLSSYFRLNVLHTWYAEGQYALNGQDYLTLLPQKVYESTQPFSVTVLQQLSLWSDDAMNAGSDADSVALPGQQLTLIGTDDRLWIHVLTESGSSAWLRLADTFSLETPNGPLYGGDALEGLCMAD